MPKRKPTKTRYASRRRPRPARTCLIRGPNRSATDEHGAAVPRNGDCVILRAELADVIHTTASVARALQCLIGELRELNHNGVAPRRAGGVAAPSSPESETLDRFIADCIAIDPNSRIQSSELHAIYKAWARANGVRERSNMAISTALSDRNWRKFKAGVMYWLGVRLTRTIHQFAEGKGSRLQGNSISAAFKEDTK